MRLIPWIGDIYREHGYIAALVTIVVLVALAVGVAVGTNTGLGDIIRWLGTL